MTHTGGGPVQTECNTERLDFQPLATREVRGMFDGGAITSDAGALLLREVEAKLGVIERFADCFTDHRDAERIEHTVGQLIAQRVYGLALGYEDLNDHDQLRHDPLMAVLVGKQDPSGQDRLRERDRGKALAGKSTLNRLELSPPRANGNSRYKKITANLGQMESLLTDFFIEAQQTPPKQIILDFDATSLASQRSDPRRSTGPLLSGLLQRVLLPAALRVLRRAPALCAASSGRSRRRGRQRRETRRPGRTYPPRVARGANHRPCRRDSEVPWLLPRKLDAMVRRARRRLYLGIGQKQPSSSAIPGTGIARGDERCFGER